MQFLRTNAHGKLQPLDDMFACLSTVTLAYTSSPGSSEECWSPFDRRDVVHMVTASEAAAHVFDSCCVVLPLPGRDVIFPSCEIGKLYLQILSHDGIEPTEPAIERSASAADEGNWLILQVSSLMCCVECDCSPEFAFTALIPM